MKTLTVVQQQRRERILTSTRDHLSAMGYERMSMRELAAAADVSTSTLYNLYQSKDTLILAALEDLLADINAQVEAQGMTGLDRFIERVKVLARQIVSTPLYAEAMGKMLFSADPSDPIVKTLLGAALSGHHAEIVEMLELGELRSDTDRDFLARHLASTGWSVILMWMKGYVALHDFEKEYLRNAVVTLMPWASENVQVRLQKML